MLVVASMFAFFQVPLEAALYFVSPAGSDANGGGLSDPWRTVSRAVAAVEAGDTVQLRGGIYRETDLVLRGQGTPSAWITIESYPGERAWIMGGLSAAFEEGGGWELVDGSIGLYRSTGTFTTSNKLGGWLMHEGIQLIQYVDAAVATTSNYTTPECYVGPGIYSQDGRIFIRLQQNPQDAFDRFGSPVPAVPPDPNPNNNRIHIFTGERILSIDNSSHIRLRNLDLGPAYNAIRIMGGSHDIEIEGCRIYFKNIGVNTVAGSYGISIGGCTFDMGFPPWIYWDDVKNTYKPADASGWNGFACYGVWVNSSIHSNLFANCFDGVLIYSGSSNSRVRSNTFIRGRDDAIDLSVGVGDIEIDHNIIRHCYEGISIVSGSGGTPGPVHVHNNIIDMTGYHRESRPPSISASAVWSSGIPWGRHGTPTSVTYGSIWKIYNNTIIARDCNGSTTIPKPYPDNLNTFYNNVTFLLSGRTANTSTLEATGGNIFWRTGGGLSGFTEPLGLEIDPGFDLPAITSETSYDPEVLWELYAPQNVLTATPGIALAGLGWPGTGGLLYRGASVGGLPQPTALWRFEGNADDAAGGGNSGALIGGPSYSTDRKQGDYSLQLSGSGQHVEVASSPALNVAKNLTLAAWVKPRSVGTLQGILTKLTGASAKQYALSIGAGGQLQFDYEYASNNYQLVSPATLPLNQWSHVAATVDSSLVVRLYLDGVQVAAQSAPAQPVTSAEPVAIGRWGGNYDFNYFEGELDDVCVYGNDALNPAQVAMLAGTPPGYALWTGAKAWAGSESSPGADPDHDRVANLEEYAFGGDPQRSDQSPLPRGVVTGGRPALFFKRLRSDLIYRVEASANLQQWSIIATNPGEIGGTVSVVDALPLQLGPRRFLRVRVSHP
jgi:hypothetical protein